MKKVEARDVKLVTSWQGWLDSNQRVRESKSLALPLGYTPMSARDEEKTEEGPEPKLRPFRLTCGVGKGIRTLDTRNHNPVL